MQLLHEVDNRYFCAALFPCLAFLLLSFFAGQLNEKFCGEWRLHTHYCNLWTDYKNPQYFVFRISQDFIAISKDIINSVHDLNRTSFKRLIRDLYDLTLVLLIPTRKNRGFELEILDLESVSVHFLRSYNRWTDLLSDSPIILVNLPPTEFIQIPYNTLQYILMVAVLVNKIAKRETIKRRWFNSDVSHAEYIQFDEISKHWSRSLFPSNNAPSRYTSGILSSLNLNFFKRVYLRHATLTSHKQTTGCLKWITLSRLNILHEQIIKKWYRYSGSQAPGKCP